MGLVNHVVPADKLMDEVTEMATIIAGNDPLAVTLTKKAMNIGLESVGLRQALREALEIDIRIESAEES